MSNSVNHFSEAAPRTGLPVISLLALALAGFITILTEALPAGLLPQISADFGISAALSGQLVTIYAIGSLVAAIPLTAMTQGLRRRPLLLAALAGFVLANSITAFSGSYALTMTVRFLAGVSAGLLWALIAGYAARMVPENQKGSAIAIAMVGTPLALAFGVPIGTFLSTWIGWRTCFGIMSILALALMMWVWRRMPDFPGQSASQQLPLSCVLTLAGVRPVLFVVFAFILAHNILYTYIAPFLSTVRMVEQTDLVLLVFGITSLLGIWIVGVLIDKHLRVLTLTSTALFGIAALMLGIASHDPVIIYAAITIWGLAFGGAATLFQTAIVKTAGDASDVAQSMLVTAWNVAIAGGGIVGGILLNGFGTSAFSPVLLILLSATIIVVWNARQHGFCR